MPRDGAIFGDLRVISVADDGVCPLAENPARTLLARSNLTR